MKVPKVKGKNITGAGSGDSYSVVLVPNEMLNYIKEKLGNEVLWVYDDDSNELFLVKRPESYTDALTGLGEDMWKNAGGVDYLKRERDEWDD
ncbi:hypothetical protein DCCM_3160 [Desulfocucumis palustris]|uniref:AbrB family transcriptional regulator n=1 Tax=Desulfocucumis palustris TaxID=1898651 RepID=A0A2L2XCI6_9FIRM|nr:hypothetical protein [Desulfocucumis palustris]GBF34049.1 hypothetical protein DCCM_3160 [Desulfocucumis palustris]